MMNKQDLVERIRNKLSLPYVVLALMLKGKKVERKQIKASLEDIGQAIKSLDELEKVASSYASIDRFPDLKRAILELGKVLTTARK